jgi:hypothetical protein
MEGDKTTEQINKVSTFFFDSRGKLEISTD